MIRRAIFAAAALLVSASGSYAGSTVTVQGSYSVGWSTTNGSNGPELFDDLRSRFTEFNLGVGTTTAAAKWFTAVPAGSAGCFGCGDTATGTITATFTFTEPSGATGVFSDTATYVADYGNDTDSITWSGASNPIVVDFTVGTILDVGLINASDWAITPRVTFDVVQGPTAAPEPGSFGLLGGALLGLGVIRYRCKRM